MEVSKVLLYCAMANPYLYTSQGMWILKPTKPLAEGKYDISVNGFVCFECDCKESWLLRRHSGFGDNYFSNCSCENIRLQERSRLTDKQLCSYLGAYGYAYHFENVKPIDPMPITKLYKDEECTIPLTKAPESYCFAYRKKEETIVFDGYTKHDKGDFVEKVLVFSIRSPWLCKEANGEKDLEVRKMRILNAGIEYK